MSGENISVNQQVETSEAETQKVQTKQKVDINILLNKVRAEQKKEKTENIIFISLISLVVVVTGIIVSL